MDRGAWWATVEELQNSGGEGNGRASVSASLPRVCWALWPPISLIRVPHLASKMPQPCFPCFLGVPVGPSFPSGVLALLLLVLPRCRKRHGISWYYKPHSHWRGQTDVLFSKNNCYRLTLFSLFSNLFFKNIDLKSIIGGKKT